MEFFSQDEDDRDYEAGAFGDARRCPHHPNVETSSADGMFDGVCGPCEGDAHDEAEAWDHDPANPERSQCGTGPARVRETHAWSYVRRADGTWPASRCVPDEIPF